MLDWPTVCTQEITTDEVPVRWHAFKVSIEKQQLIEAQIQDLFSLGPLFSTGFSGGGSSKEQWRIQTLYRLQWNECQDRPRCLPYAPDILESLNGATVFCTLVLKSGYWQLEMESESIQKTAFVTSTGRYEFVCLPLGLKNATVSLQRLMEHILCKVKGKCCMVYIDGIVVYSKTMAEHL